MANNSNNTKQSTKAVAKVTNVAVESTYAVAEFVKASKKLNASPDIVKAAFKCAGKTQATLEEAKKIVNTFKSKEVK